MTVLALAVSGRGLVDPDEPVLRADDEALLRGRAAFETLRVYGGRPFRLERAPRATGRARPRRIGLPASDRGELRGLAAIVARRGGQADAVLRLYWTAGRDGRRARRRSRS